MFENMDQRKLTELVTRDETWVHFFQPERKIKKSSLGWKKHEKTYNCQDNAHFQENVVLNIFQFEWPSDTISYS